jgi:hypothetical protein
VKVWVFGPPPPPPPCPFSGVGLESIMPHNSISLSVTFGMPENYHTESILFYVA